MSKDGKWAAQILAQQRADGSFGFIHTLSQGSGSPIPTEQALRRLLVLGYTTEDKSIRRALAYLVTCLEGQQKIPDRQEKGHSWDLFVELMLSAWVRLLTHENAHANRVAALWRDIITGAFSSGAYSPADYTAVYTAAYGDKPHGPRLEDFVTFYQVSLLAGQLEPATERLVLNYLLHHEGGVYYLYRDPLAVPPPFCSRQASQYLGVLELLARYSTAPDALGFAADWLLQNQQPDGGWDMGAKAQDGVYFPLSDSWRTPALRQHDCTQRIQRLLDRLRPQASPRRNAALKEAHYGHSL